MARAVIEGGITSQEMTNRLNANFIELYSGAEPATGSIVSAMLATGAVTSAKIASGAVTSTKIASGAVTKAMVGLDRASNITISYGTATPTSSGQNGDIYIMY